MKTFGGNVLATIQKIGSKRKNPNADTLSVYTMEGMAWQVVDKSDKFEVGDYCIFVQVDTVMPDAEWCAFMKDRKFRVRSVRFRGELSQGLMFPLEVLPTDEWKNAKLYTEYKTDIGWYALDDNIIGAPVHETLGITKYEKPFPTALDARGDFPRHIISVTDEERIQNFPHVLDMLDEVDITVKHDGSSLTFIKSGEIKGEKGEILCSRKLMLKQPEEDKSNNFWQAYDKYKLSRLPDDICIQGELCGGKIQGNKEQIQGVKLYVFNVFSQITGWYSNQEVRDFCKEWGLDCVKHVYTGPLKWDVQGLLDLADEQKYDNGSQAEGIVVRSTKKFNENYTSFKVISNKFLLKNKE